MSYVCCDVMIILEYAHDFTKELYRMHLNKRPVGHIAHLSNNSKIKSYLWSQIQISRQYSIPFIKISNLSSDILNLNIKPLL